MTLVLEYLTHKKEGQPLKIDASWVLGIVDYMYFVEPWKMGNFSCFQEGSCKLVWFAEVAYRPWQWTRWCNADRCISPKINMSEKGPFQKEMSFEPTIDLQRPNMSF